MATMYNKNVYEFQEEILQEDYKVCSSKPRQKQLPELIKHNKETYIGMLKTIVELNKQKDHTHIGLFMEKGFAHYNVFKMYERELKISMKGDNFVHVSPLEQELYDWKKEANENFCHVIVNSNNLNAHQEANDTYKSAINAHTIEYLNNGDIDIKAFYRRLNNSEGVDK